MFYRDPKGHTQLLGHISPKAGGPLAHLAPQKTNKIPFLVFLYFNTSIMSHKEPKGFPLLWGQRPHNRGPAGPPSLPQELEGKEWSTLNWVKGGGNGGLGGEDQGIKGQVA